MTSPIELLRSYDRGEITYPQLLADFRAMPMSVQQPAASIGEAYATAEEVNDADVPEAISTAAYAGIITSWQKQDLLGIYRSKV